MIGAGPGFVRQGRVDGEQQPEARPLVRLAVQQDGASVAVDDAEEESEVLLKPLGFPLTGMPGVVGGTIRPDGSVQIVLDVADAAFRPSRARPSQPTQEPRPASRIFCPGLTLTLQARTGSSNPLTTRSPSDS